VIPPFDRKRLRAGAAWMLAALGLGCAGRTGLRDLEADSMNEAREGVQLVGGFMHTCALFPDGRVKCWGFNNYGQLGLGDGDARGDQPNEMGDNLPAIDLGTGNTVEAIAAGAYHTCALLNDGRVRCWGANEWGQLGLGDVKNRGDDPNEMGDNLPAIDLGTDKTAVAIAAGSAHTCALLNDDRVRCWGANTWGQLGLGDETNRGDDPNEMGDNLPAIDLGTGKTAVAITAGSAHTCARMSDSRVKCWGDNEHGQLGLGDATDRGDDPNEMGDKLPDIDLGTSKAAMAIMAGGVHTCALLEGGRIKCWGLALSGQLGLGDTGPRGNKPNQMGDNLPAVDLGTGMIAVALVTSSQNTCALLEGGRVKCWGFNMTGELGLGDTVTRGDKPNQMGDNLPAVNLGTGTTAAAISVNNSSTCARMSDGRVKCWGNSSAGQLGLGDADARGDEPNEMGDNLPPVDL
jgi:alpha-tubulin suppressor-like RCC1 family protein